MSDSSRKRRKRNPEISVYQEKLPEVIPAKIWKRYLTSYSTGGYKEYHLVLKRYSTMEDEKCSFEEMNGKDKAILLLSFKKNKMVRRKFETCLEKVKYKELKKLHDVYIEKVKLSKVITARSLVSFFYGEKPDYQKRKEESENIASLENSGIEFRFVKMCDILLPKEIVVHILSYLKYNKKMLFVIGSTNKSFYFNVLSSWRKIVVLKNKLYKISLLVLSNVKEIGIMERYGKEKFTQKEFSYLLEKIGWKRIRNIDIRLYTNTSLNSFFKCCRKKKVVFNNCSAIQFQFTSPTQKAIIEDSIEWLVPNLKDLRFPFSFSFVKNLTVLKKLRFLVRNYEATPIELVKKEDVPENIVDLHVISRVTPFKTVSSLKLLCAKIESVRVLKVDLGGEGGCDFSFLKTLENLETWSLSIKWKTFSSRTSMIFPLAMKNLREFEIWEFSSLKWLLPVLLWKKLRHFSGGGRAVWRLPLNVHDTERNEENVINSIEEFLKLYNNRNRCDQYEFFELELPRILMRQMENTLFVKVVFLESQSKMDEKISFNTKKTFIKTIEGNFDMIYIKSKFKRDEDPKLQNELFWAMSELRSIEIPINEVYGCRKTFFLSEKFFSECQNDHNLLISSIQKFEKKGRCKYEVKDDGGKLIVVELNLEKYLKDKWSLLDEFLESDMDYL